MPTHQDQISGGPGSPRGGRRAAVLIGLAIGAGGLLAGCGDDEDSAGTSSAPETTMAGDEQAAAPEEADQVEIAEFLYAPEAVTVAAGTEVTWTNSDTAPHTATADDSSFDTGTLKKSDAGSATFDEPGTYAYYCRFHPFMKGTVEVR